MINKMDYYIKKHDIKSCKSLYMSLHESERMSKTMTAFSVVLKIASMEEDKQIKGLFWRKDCESVDDLVSLYYRVKYYIRRIEYDVEQEVENELINLNISKYMLLIMISLFSIDKVKVICYLMHCFKIAGDKEIEQALYEFLCKAESLNGETCNG